MRVVLLSRLSTFRNQKSIFVSGCLVGLNTGGIQFCQYPILYARAPCTSRKSFHCFYRYECWRHRPGRGRRNRCFQREIVIYQQNRYNFGRCISIDYCIFVNLSSDCYKTINAPAQGIFKDKGSKFIAYAYPIRSEHDAKERLATVKGEHPKARHHCWAYRLTPDGLVFRINDNGEPSGTAGRPILNTLMSLGVTNIMVIVVRYFGGTLLGVPGLINAYKTATQEVLSNAEIVERQVMGRYRISFEYERMNDVMRVVKEESL